MMVTDRMYEAAVLLMVLAVTVNSQGPSNGNGQNDNDGGGVDPSNGNGNADPGSNGEGSGPPPDPGPEPFNDCPADTVGFDEGCYWLGDDLTDYAVGEAFCQAGGGKLAVFYRRADVPHAAATLASLVGTDKFWIGLNKDNNILDQWQWDGYPWNQMGNQNWHTFENQKPKNPGERCATGLRMDTQVNWEWYSEDCGATFFPLCVDGGPDPPEVNGDPHFLITSITEENTHLCFDVDGEDEDVLMLLQDADLELQVNGEMFSPKSNQFNQAFFSSISVTYGDYNIVATQDGITIDDSHTVQWDSTYGVHLDEEASVSSVDKSTVLIVLAYDVQMRIKRSQTSDGSYYLGLFVTHNGGIGDDATGIIGNLIRSRFTVIPSTESESNGIIEFSEQPISVPVHRVTRYSRAHHGRVECWLYKVDTKATEDGLLGKRSSYTVSDLKYTPF